ncbi:MAG: BtaA family protein [Verrucomicrobiae bacterium]|nr:BtaA family protein [Verrucomicrobiae bacterium]
MIAHAQARPSLRQRAHDALFNKVHTGNLIYNTCWEDPRQDLQMMALNSQSRVVMITSAGCNALDYLLAGPAHVHAVDMNPRQNSLLQLKMAMIARENFDDLFQLFGEGSHPGFPDLLKAIRPALPSYAAKFWKEKAHYFKSTRLNPSFYYRGTAGRMAWLARQSFLGTNKKVRKYMHDLLDSKTVEEQQDLYEQVRPMLWNGFVKWLLAQPLAMAMLGVPRAQIRLIETRFPGGLTGYIQAKLEHVFTQVPFQDNYFWRVYLTGRYTRDCCPRYLQAEHQPLLRHNLPRLTTHTSTMANFLRENPGSYSHYVLLDHQDWLAAHMPEALNEEWKLILQNSRPGTRILMRSASPVIDFIPGFARRHLKMDEALAGRLHILDRVGTYGSTLFAEIVS